MGLRRISDGQFRISPEEWQRMQMRRHHIHQLIILSIELIAIVAFILFMRWLGVR